MLNIFVGRGICAVHLVVGGHDRPCIPFLTGHFEGRQINFTKRTFSDFGTIYGTELFLVVTDKMLYASGDILTLNPAHIGGCNFTGQQRIFAKIFKTTSAERGAHNINARAKQNAAPAGSCFPAQSGSDLFHQFFIPAGGHGDASGEIGGNRPADSLGTIRHFDSRNIQPFDTPGFHTGTAMP